MGEGVGIHRRWGSGCQTLSSDSFPETPVEKGSGRAYHHLKPFLTQTIWNMWVSALLCSEPSPASFSFLLTFPWLSSSSSESKTRSPMVMDELHADVGHAVGKNQSQFFLGILGHTQPCSGLLGRLWGPYVVLWSHQMTCFGATPSSGQRLLLALFRDFYWVRVPFWGARDQTPVSHVQGRCLTYYTITLAPWLCSEQDLLLLISVLWPYPVVLGVHLLEMLILNPGLPSQDSLT